ncbi:MAG: hypothetical protein HY748_00890 [Elusimicrobia bacterium]|nr:hypothetical protein [Elusimicrobiota bacterium]
MEQASAGTSYRFSLTRPGSKPGLLKAVLALAVKETEIIFGKARLKLEAGYDVSAAKPVCVIEGGTECGEHLAKLLAGFLIKQVGEFGFRVQRLRNGKGG